MLHQLGRQLSFADQWPLVLSSAYLPGRMGRPASSACACSRLLNLAHVVTPLWCKCTGSVMLPWLYPS